MSNHMEIAKTIQKQLIEINGNSVIWSWGQHALQAVSDKNLEVLDVKGEGALKFKVQGYHHKGHVLIVLNGKDTYDVFICNIRKNKMTTKESCMDLDFTQIGSYIDEKVERIEKYAS